jgi:NADPH:quinone reductase-like Zn-dependent oxidoreductase
MVPGTFEIRELPEPTAAAGEVVVQVQACGLNHLDLWLEEAGLPIAAITPDAGGRWRGLARAGAE